VHWPFIHLQLKNGDASGPLYLQEGIGNRQFGIQFLFPQIKSPPQQPPQLEQSLTKEQSESALQLLSIFRTALSTIELKEFGTKRTNKTEIASKIKIKMRIGFRFIILNSISSLSCLRLYFIYSCK